MTALFMFPDLSQRTVGAVDWIVVWNWQSRDPLIGSGSLAWLTSEQIPFASIGVGSNNGKVRAGADLLVSNPGWNHDDVAGVHLDVTALLGADSQGRSTTINAKRFMLVQSFSEKHCSIMEARSSTSVVNACR